MSAYTIASIIITLAVLFGFINHRFIRLQSTIAIMAGALFLSLILLVLQNLGITDLTQHTRNMLIRTNFHNLLLNGMLSFLLFAGALTIDLEHLKTQKWEIGILASASTICSTFIIGTAIYYGLPLLHLPLPYLYCLLFGALISPTDPIAVLATFKEVGAPKDLEACVSGESLFNDGVGIVVFLTLYSLTFQHTTITLGHVAWLFLEQAIGGMVYGFIIGQITAWLIRQCNDYNMAILITLATVTGGYTFALAIHISGALAMVVAGIIVGNTLRYKIHNKQQTEILTVFWEVIDEALNAVLFLLIGFELLTLNANLSQLAAALLCIPLVLVVRLITVAIPIKLLQFVREHNPYAVSVLTWGGLRGGLAVALALSLPPSHYRDFILAMTYAVVAFAVIVQGLSIKPLAKIAKDATT